MIAAVTGATGHVGGVLARTLLERGHGVRALVRDDGRTLEGLGVERVHGDLGDPASLERAFAGADAVVHAAAHLSLLRTDTRHVEAVNVAGTAAVLAACKSAGVHRLVHFSSIHALEQRPFDRAVDEERPLADERPVRGLPPYDRSKAAGERLVREAAGTGLEAVILNPTGMLGPFDFKPSLFGRVLVALANGRLPAIVDGGFDWVDVRDVAASAAAAAELLVAGRAAGRRYLLPGRWASLAEVAGMVADCTGVPAPRWSAPLWAARVGAPFSTAAALVLGHRPLFTGVSLAALRGNPQVSGERAAADLEHRPRDLRDSVADTVRWFADRGIIAPHDPTSGRKRGRP
ncbi:MAG: NAD-dependent epimerase/dehydratase family protein [Spirochaetes bacterium]|nr:NAD-dependent epimerase/dehydratase family protein [Spirochaetota bacterium]